MLKDHFQLNQLTLNYDNPKDFLRPLASKRQLLFVIYRWAFALYFPAIAVYDLSYRFPHPTGKWFKDLTHWSYITLMLHTWVQAVLATDYYVNSTPTSTQGCCTNYVQMDWKTKIAWILNNLTIVQAPIVSVIYWVIVFDPDTYDVQIVNVTTHAVNLAYVVLEFCISGIPVRILHFYQIFIFGLIYCIFTVIYWKAGGTNNHGKPYIYSVLNYGEDPGKATLWVVFIHIAVVLVHCVWSVLYQLKLMVYKRFGWIETEQQADKTVKFQEIPMA